jgi:hypothetical protein
MTATLDAEPTVTTVSGATLPLTEARERHAALLTEMVEWLFALNQADKEPSRTLLDEVAETAARLDRPQMGAEDLRRFADSREDPSAPLLPAPSWAVLSTLGGDMHYSREDINGTVLTVYREDEPLICLADMPNDEYTLQDAKTLRDELTALLLLAETA